MLIANVKTWVLSSNLLLAGSESFEVVPVVEVDGTGHQLAAVSAFFSEKHIPSIGSFLGENDVMYYMTYKHACSIYPCNLAL